MKTTALFIAIVVNLTGAAHADIHLKPIFEMRSNELIRVDSEWRSDCPKRLKVTFRVDADVPSNDVVIRAYFFNAEKVQVARFDAPAQVWKDTPQGFQGVALPEVVPKNRDVEVYFPLTKELDKVWKSVVVVCGDSTERVARSRPAAAIDDLDFPGKDTTKIVKN